MTPCSYHTHTTYCDGKNTPEELVQEAISRGCPAIGFSGHAHTPFDESYCMSPAGTRAYREEVLSLRERYRGQIKILLGLEQDLYADAPTDGYDYSIGSVHYVQKNGCYLPMDESRVLQVQTVQQHYGGDFYAFAADYYAAVATLYEKTHCTIIGHFDLISKFNEDGTLFDPDHPRYRAAALQALVALTAAPVIFEVNYGAVARGYRTAPYPAPWMVEYLKAHGKKLLYTSDCHQKENLLYGLPEDGDYDFL